MANSCEPCERRIRERQQVQVEHARYEEALQVIARCNDGKGYMPSVARQALGWTLLPDTVCTCGLMKDNLKHASDCPKA